MSTRDEELAKMDREVRDALRGSPTPAIDPGDKRPIGDGTSCFLNMDRECGPDCRAFNPTMTGESPDACTIIAGVTDIAKNLEQLLEVGGLLKKLNQDKARTASGPAIPDPTGRTSR